MPVLPTIRVSFSRFNWKLYLSLLIRLILPTIYQTFRVSLLGALPDSSSLSIAAQMQWVNLLLEITEEGLLKPLYHCLGLTIGDREETKNKVKTGFMVCAGIYVIFSATISAAASPLVTFMGQNETLHEDTVQYIRLEMAAIFFSSLANFLLIVMVMHDWNGAIYASLGVQMVSSITLDVLLVSQKVANLGAIGVALSSIGTAIFVLTINFAICWKKLNIGKTDFFGPQAIYSFSWFRRWTKVGIYSALDSLIRNGVYLVVILRAMNMLDSQDAYWVATIFIWNWLLLPALPLADLLKQDVARKDTDPLPHWRKTSAYFVIVGGIFILWAISYPLWKLFITYVLNADEPELVMELAQILVPCYTGFVVSNLINAVFYAFGRTEFLVLIALPANALLVTLFLLMIYGVIANTVYTVALYFGIGLLVGAVFTGIAYGFFVRRHRMF